MYQRLHGDFLSPGNKFQHHLKQLMYAAPVYSSTKSVQNYSKVAYLKQSKPRLVILLLSSFFFLQPAQCLNARCYTFKTAVKHENSSQGWYFCAYFEVKHYMLSIFQRSLSTMLDAILVCIHPRNDRIIINVVHGWDYLQLCYNVCILIKKNRNKSP